MSEVLQRQLVRPNPPRLEWPGRDNPALVLTDEQGRARRVPRPALPLYHLVEVQRQGEAENLLIHGENYFALEALLAAGYGGQVDLVYIDPPFNTGRRFAHYDDRLALADWLSMLQQRLLLLHRLLAPSGSLILHLDDHTVHHARLLLDEIFGPENFRNSIIVKRVTKNLQRQFTRIQALPLAHDACLLYSKEPGTRYPLPLVAKPAGPKHPEGYWKDFWSTADRPTMRYELLGVTPPRGQWKWCAARAAAAVANYQEFLASGAPSLLEWWRERGEALEFIRLQPTGKVAHWVAPSATRCADTWWDEFSAYSFGQGFPTEKSEALLSRFIEFFSRPGGLVLDCFAGSGTTGVVAGKLGRRFVMVERGEQAQTHIAPRLERGGLGYRQLLLEPREAFAEY
ncbi:MAG: site-specific DNA-methyltransferase [Armatimonadetes bacterium]|nr:site-specific DNA-methyltransferase [Armatimonadota bacterium]